MLEKCKAELTVLAVAHAQQNSAQSSLTRHVLNHKTTIKNQYALSHPFGLHRIRALFLQNLLQNTLLISGISGQMSSYLDRVLPRINTLKNSIKR